MSPEFVEKYMMAAKSFGETKNACRSRKIGTFIVNPLNNRIIGAGYNSPPSNTPHPDSSEYIKRYLIPKLNENLDYAHRLKDFYDEGLSGWDVEKLQNAFCHACPRKVMGFASGEASEICTCAHSEQNAIANKCEDATGAYMFAYCGVPCRDCAKMIVNSRIARVYVISNEVYHHDTVEFFIDAGVGLYLFNEVDKTVTRLLTPSG